MKIALISPPWIPIPPAGYGGIESVVYHLAEGLKAKGHEVILYATGDSNVSVDLRYFYKKSLGRDALLEKEHIFFFLSQMHFALKDMPKDVDIIHNHCEYAGMYLLDQLKTPFIHTLHGAFYKAFSQHRDTPDHSLEAYRETLQFFNRHPFISISNNQRTGMPNLNYIDTIYNGVNLADLPFQETSQDYMCWLGRYSVSKGLDKAIEVAKKTNKKLVFSASLHKSREALFQEQIMPYVDNKQFFYQTETTTAQAKSDLIKNAKLFLFPLQWEEPFGIVMAESMACGTPVAAYARGSIPEVVRDGVTGFLVNPSDEDIRGDYVVKKTGIAGLAEAVQRIYALSPTEYQQMRKTCREHVEKYFTVEKMVEAYEKAYQQVLTQGKA